MGKRVDEARELRERAMRGDVPPAEVRGIRPTPEQTYLGGAAFGTMDMKERVQLLDREGMAKAVLYPTLGLLWEAELFDPELSSAYCRAYNRWIADFCRGSGGRLIPIAHLSLGDPMEAARELERAVKDGCRGAFVCPFTITRVPHGDPRHDAVFAAAQDLDVPLCRASDVRADRVQRPPSLRQVRLGGLVLQSLRRPGRAAGVRHLLPVRRLRALPAPARGRPRVPGRLDRLLPRPRRRDLHRDAARRDRAAEGEAVVLLQAAVLHLGGPGRAHDRRADAARRRGQVLLGERLPAPRSSRRVSGRAARDGRADDGVRTPGNPGRKRRACLQACITRRRSPWRTTSPVPGSGCATRSSSTSAVVGRKAPRFATPGCR